MKYHEIVWTFQDVTDRWPATSLYIVCWPLIVSILHLIGGRV